MASARVKPLSLCIFVLLYKPNVFELKGFFLLIVVENYENSLILNFNL